MTADSSYSLEALERRWQLERTPQVGLRLAEEHRRKGDLAAAAEILESGLEAHPDHMASRVALSRYLVDDGRFGAAVLHLERIVRIDPAHLVANKLLVRAYAGVGRPDDARDKLDIYEMLGEGDVDIEQLRESLEDAKRNGLAPTAELETAEERSSAAPPSEPEMTPVAGVDADAPFAQAVVEEPFGSAWTADQPSDYWREVADEGIFALEPTEAPETDEVARPAEPAEIAELAELAELPEIAEQAPTLEPATPATPSTDAPTDPTATLGQLYLDQGHRREAAEVFNEVLTREPGNEAARRGLEVMVDPAVSSDTGTEEGEQEEEPMADVLERKRSVLTAYLEQIRRSVEAGV